MDPITDEDKNRLVYSLLGLEGTSRSASNPDASFVEFSEVVKTFFQPLVNPLHAHFDFLHRHQQEGETAAEFLGVLWTLLINCDIRDAGEYQRLLAKQLVMGCQSKDTAEASGHGRA